MATPEAKPREITITARSGAAAAVTAGITKVLEGPDAPVVLHCKLCDWRYYGLTAKDHDLIEYSFDRHRCREN